MHANSMKLMAAFVAKHCAPGMSVLDIGSCDVNGNYRGLFSRMEYTGVDIAAGPNVDIVMGEYAIPGLDGKTFDIVISGQTLEHVFEPWKTCELIGRHCHGKTCVIVPWKHSLHRHPVDCYRFMPDGLTYLMETFGKFKTLECEMDGPDCYYIGEKQ